MNMCSQCKIEKEVEEFTKKGKGTWCIQCHNTYNIKYQKEHKDKMKDIMRKYIYGVSKEKYNTLLLLQDNKCAICNQYETTKDRNGNIKILGIDHCHTTGKIRSLLCTKCNMLLGYAKDNIDILKSAIEYLEKHNDVITE